MCGYRIDQSQRNCKCSLIVTGAVTLVYMLGKVKNLYMWLVEIISLDVQVKDFFSFFFYQPHLVIILIKSKFCLYEDSF